MVFLVDGEINDVVGLLLEGRYSPRWTVCRERPSSGKAFVSILVPVAKETRCSKFGVNKHSTADS